MRISLFYIALVFCLLAPTALSQKQVVVVIDPGHGGHDPGHEAAFEGHLDEKELALKISMFLGGYMEKYLQNVKVVYTRTTDVYPSLDERVNMANSIGADYFISIHCNGADRRNVRGTETIVHSLELTKSVALASAIEKQFSSRAGRKSRGVKDKRDLHHSIQVLKYTNMPGTLVECGFMTNKAEANYLNTTYGQEIIASAIFRAFRSTIQQEYPTVEFVRPQDSRPNPGDAVAANNAKYGIQIASSINPIDPHDPSFRRAKMEVERRKLNTTSAYKYIYIVGDYGSRKEAKDELVTVRDRGFKDAIVVKR